MRGEDVVYVVDVVFVLFVVLQVPVNPQVVLSLTASGANFLRRATTSFQKA